MTLAHAIFAAGCFGASRQPSMPFPASGQPESVIPAVLR